MCEHNCEDNWENISLVMLSDEKQRMLRQCKICKKIDVEIPIL